MDWYLYVLCCNDDSFYTGITTDIDRRLHEHNHSKLGAKYTKNKRPVILKLQASFPNRSRATKAELKFKKLSRAKKEQVLEGKSDPPWNPSTKKQD